MNKEEFKNYVNEIAKNELRNSFDNNLMETLNSAFIFKYVETLEKENKELKEVIDKAIDYIGSNDIEVLKYHDIPSETTSYEIVTVDLLKILKEVE